jgi:hypothetical protein
MNKEPTMEFTQDMVCRMMDEMDKRLLKGDQNVWKDACENARYGIAREILDAALNGKKNKKED